MMKEKKDRKNETYVVSAEYQILKLLIAKPELLDTNPELIEDNFPHEQARCIFNGLYTLYKANETINTLSILREANKLNDEIDLDLILHVESVVVDDTSFNNALSLLKSESNKYKISKKLDSLYGEVNKLGTIDEAKMQNLLWEAQQLAVNSSATVESKTLPDCLDDYMEDLDKRKSGEYYSFGDMFLDESLTRKASGGQLILISAATGMGKSGYALNLINGMINMEIPCMYFSLEMDEISTFDRLLSMRTQIPIKEWYVKDNIDTLKLKVLKEKETLQNKCFRFIDNPNLSLMKIQALIREFKRFYKKDYVCVYIDLITQVKEFIDMEYGGGTLATAIEQAVNKLNAIAKSENVCFVCVAQMKRTVDDMKISKVEDTDKLKPTLGSIKNSGALAERSRVVLSVFRARPYVEKYLPDDPKLEYMQDIMEITILKQNQGGIAQGKYLFDPSIMTALPYIEEDADIKF
jgi:replicative DNA helicase